MTASLENLFLDSATLGTQKIVAQILQAFIDLDFSIDEFEIEDEAKSGTRRLQSSGSALLSDNEEFSFRAYHTKWQFEIRQQIAWGEKRLGGKNRAWIRTSTDNTPYFWNREYDPDRYSRLFLDLGKSLYTLVRPQFGWADFNYGLFTAHIDIEKLALPALYWANYFGPDYVSKIGRDRIRNAPAWAIEDLPDGGILYILASSPGLATYQVPIEKVKSYFNVSQVR